MLPQFVMTYLPMIWMCFQLIIVTLRYQITECRVKMSTTTLKPYTMEEIRSRIDQAERESAAGLGIEGEEMIRELEAEFAKEDIKLNLN